MLTSHFNLTPTLLFFILSIFLSCSLSIALCLLHKAHQHDVYSPVSGGLNEMSSCVVHKLPQYLQGLQGLDNLL